MGPNGAGKSSTIGIIGLIKPTFGSININNKNINDYAIYERTKKFHMSLVPQSGGYFAGLLAEVYLS